MTIQLTLDEEKGEAQYLNDILQMWIEGIEASIPDLSTESTEETHWSKFGLRAQLQAAESIRMRLTLELGVSPS